MIAIVVHIHCTFDCLEEGLLVDAGDEETTLVESLRALGRGADAHCREGMTNTGEERRFFGECTRVRNDCIGIHLEAVVVMEAKRLVLDDAWIELEARSSKTIAAAWMAAVEDGHIVLLCHCIDGIEEREEVLLSVDVLFSMCRQQDVFSLLKAKTLVHITCLNLSKVLVEHFSHR